MSDYSFDPYKPKRKMNSGILVGLIAAVIMMGVHLFFMLILSGQNSNGWIHTGDWIANIIQLFVYFFASHSAAERQYHNQERDATDALRGVRAAGIGAAITTSLLVWVFIIVREIIYDATGVTVTPDPFGLCAWIVVDVLLAIGLGAWAGGMVEKKYRPQGY